jgi:hypothetical protein
MDYARALFVHGLKDWLPYKMHDGEIYRMMFPPNNALNCPQNYADRVGDVLYQSKVIGPGLPNAGKRRVSVTVGGRTATWVF